jgi:hypothetical protein
MYFVLSGHNTRCFGIHVATGHKILGDYVVSGFGEDKVLTRVITPSKLIEYEGVRLSSEGKFEIEAKETGVYNLCFNNLDSNSNVISFDYRHWDLADSEGLASEEHLKPLENELRVLSNKLDSVYRNINFYERREKTHRDLIERTCDRVLWSVLGKIVILSSIAFTQIYMLKTTFDDKGPKI